MIPIYRPYFPKSSLRFAHDAIDSGWISSQGKYVSIVVEKLQELLNIKYVLPVFNGTVACHLLAKSLTKKSKSTLIVPNNVYVAAWNGFLFDGNWDLFSVECDLNTWNYDLNALDKAINDIPGAVVLVVHNIGNIINVPELQRKYPNTIFAEDNCEGLFGKYEDRQSGTASFASAISFFGNKNITSGEGGAFITNDQNTYNYIKHIHSQAQSGQKFVHNDLGYNYRITNVQAAILTGQLEILPEILDKKRDVFETYRAALKDREDILTQSIAPGTEHANWMFGIRLPGKDNFKVAQSYFKSQNIEIRPMFFPIDKHAYLKDNCLVNIGDCANADTLNKECIILPSFPDLTRKEIQHILTTLDNYVRNK